MSIVVVHVVSGMLRGGAEAMLLKLVSETQGKGVNHVVVSLSSSNEQNRSVLNKLDVPLYELNLKKSFVVGGLFSLYRIFKKHLYAGGVVQTWMYHGDVIGGAVAYVFSLFNSGKISICWNVRRTEVPRFSENPATYLISRIGALLSYIIPDVIVSCANAAKESHSAKGYNQRKFRIISNGFDVSLYVRNEAGRFERRKEMSIGPDNILVGVFGRYSPIKGYDVFLRAFKFAYEKNRNIRGLIVGRGLLKSSTVSGLIEELNLRDAITVFDERDDLPSLYSALDIYCLPSRSEGFPNVLGEAMSSSLPCITTDCGDAAYLLGNAGAVVPVENVLKMSIELEAFSLMSSRERQRMGEMARDRIVSLFSIQAVAQEYVNLYRELN